MAYQHILVERAGQIERLVLNRPDVRNAFNDHMIAELTDWAARLSERSVGERPRVVVLGGAGKLFCAGADVTWMAKTIEYTEEQNLRDAEAMSGMFAALDGLPVPLVGRIHGAALGGGAGLAAVCDIVVAEDGAVFGFTEVKLGILPAVISPFALAKIGRSAARAKEVGLVHTVVPAADLDASVDAYLRELLTAGPEAVTAAKALIPQVWEKTIENAATITARAIARRRASREGQEGLRAFLEKRPAAWTTHQDQKA